MKQHPDQSNITVKSKPIVPFKITGNILWTKQVCFLCWLPASALEKDQLFSFAPSLFARVKAMEEDPALLKGECARQIHSSLHSITQRSCFPEESPPAVVSTCKGNIYSVSAVDTRQYKDPFYLVLLISVKKKIVLLKASFFSTSTNESVFSAIFHTPVSCACPVWPSPAEMNIAVLRPAHN